MLTVIENKRRTIAAAATAVLLLLVGFFAGRVNQSTPAGAAPQIAALTAHTARLQAGEVQAADRNAAQLNAANVRLASQLAAVRACAQTNHLRPCLRRALR